jgi:hypothetical protein
MKTSPRIFFSQAMLRRFAAGPLSSASAALLCRHARPLSSVVPARVTLTLEQAISSGHLIISELKSPQMLQALEAGKQGDKLAKWQQANAVLIQATLRALPGAGFTSDPLGLQAYTEAFAEIARSEAPEQRAVLQAVNTAKWSVLLEHAFECKPAPPMSLDEARSLAIAMVDALQEPTLLKQMEEARTGIAARLSEPERQQLVARAVLGVQSDVIAARGYEGDAGYAQAQVCLMDHATDAVVSAPIAAATSAVYMRAGINLQAALMQAMGQQ